MSRSTYEHIHVASWPHYKAPHGNLYSKALSTAHAICAQTFVIVSNGRVSREVLEELGLEGSPEIQPKGGGLSGFIRPDIIKFDVNREPVQPLPEDSMRKGVIHHLPESGQKLGTV